MLLLTASAPCSAITLNVSCAPSKWECCYLKISRASFHNRITIGNLLLFPVSTGAELLREQNLEHMIGHVFLPRKLPEGHANFNRLERTEKCLLGTLCDVINEFKLPLIPETVKKMFESIEQLQFDDQFDPKVLAAQIGELQAKQMLGVYMRKANCGLFLVRTPSADTIIAATFQANLSDERIYGDVPSHKINKDIQVKYLTERKIVDFNFIEIISHYIAG